MSAYLILFVIVLGVNLMPAFGPPTWSVIVIYGLSALIPLVPLVLIGAAAAALGRFGLATAFRYLRNYVPARMKRNLEAAGRAIEGRKRHSWLALGLFALSPLPSAQLFEAAGLMGIGLLRFTGAFFAGRLVSYTIYAATAKHIQATTLGSAFRDTLVSPLGIAFQVGMIALLVAVSQIDWEKRFGLGKAVGKQSAEP